MFMGIYFAVPIILRDRIKFLFKFSPVQGQISTGQVVDGFDEVCSAHGFLSFGKSP